MKIHFLKFFPAKSKKKMRATAVRKPLRAATTADYDDLAEPNMKLSRALLIVLLLHVVAVSGIVAFNAIKTHQGPALPSVRPLAAAAESPAPAKAEGAVHPAASSKEPSHSESARTSRSTAVKATKEEHRPEHIKVTDSGKTHVVAKGENPLTIAKKFKVPYDDLLAINHIDDPHKLQIGQKLIIPAKPKPKKTEN